MLSLFADAKPWQEPLASGVVILQRFAFDSASSLPQAIVAVTRRLSFRQMVTPGGYIMSVAMANCDHLGWMTDQHDYLYSPFDSLTGTHWPPLPDAPADLCQQAAAAAGYTDFQPDARLINCYMPGAEPSLHQNKDEPDLRAPIVSVSLGLPAIFQFDGLCCNDPSKRLLLERDDAVVWDGNSRLFYHGVQSLKTGHHPLTGGCRYNLTFRLAGRKE